MRKHTMLLCAAGAAILLLYAALLFAPAARAPQQDAQTPSAARGPSTIAEETDAYALFGGVAGKSVSWLTVVTPESEYAFRCADGLRVSVNGQKADRDVYATLLDQILTMPVVSVSPFTPTEGAFVTLALGCGAEQYTAAFYRDADEESPYMSIISGDSDAPCYQRTDIWRLGTLLLACEGTRIQDEKGEETPFAQ